MDRDSDMIWHQYDWDIMDNKPSISNINPLLHEYDFEDAPELYDANGNSIIRPMKRKIGFI